MDIAPVSALALYEEALHGATVHAVHAVHAVRDPGPRLLDVPAWTGALTGADESLLERCEGPVIDIGCGPGRLAAALTGRGVPCLGIDISRRAVARARARGASALLRAVERRLPGEGRWGTALLADGNIGIGGDPEALLRRCADLVRPAGLVLVEADPDPTLDVRGPLVLEAADGRRSHPVPWARLGATGIGSRAGAAGLRVVEVWTHDARTFLSLGRDRQRADDAGR
ncbi:Methyltransferase type 11 [Beutenbergia cavernae DSM 12333]|uniref:Methyltransferase type 11 n=1 Tax=Beutenbergia cavernae (strain ATCC BAA-8 / DSM 12333 / CCUG 43141 / JCM 11478 / NBRC 16432 / NCIMB 13614 / HKI 0122) TaxID=471853 RepID=C5C005_BEUC1|nr:methyltransferase domain-containing protein [Beutenbergia cavernae]ACQ81335.1 Methyltransferase type 11 [Beutenbergia cavernae DSM 12333]